MMADDMDVREFSMCISFAEIATLALFTVCNVETDAVLPCHPRYAGQTVLLCHT